MDAEAVAQAKGYLRVLDTSEDAAIGGLVEAALGVCEGFIGQIPVARTVSETLAVTGGWVRLSATPVRTITSVQALAADGTATALPVAAYAIDIDGRGEGWVRVTAGGAARVRVTAEAGLATAWSGLPQSIRQGAVRLAAHLFTHRDGADDPGPPAVVAALWRPFRRMRLQ
jgi:uncharacterized phiE125 gp8 family phage protein